MALLDHVLEAPSYGYSRNGQLYVPTYSELFREFFSRLNIFKTPKNWLPLWGWATSLSLAVPFYLFVTEYWTWPLAFWGFIYSMVILGTHGTIYYHRYSTHRGYTFKNRFWRWLVSTAVIKLIPEEVYVVSHYVHHYKSEKPGDPYNVFGGWWYCFLADANHQLVNRNLSEAEYKKVCLLLNHTSVRANTYQQYLRWGSICHPAWTILQYATNWATWYTIFYLIGGHPLSIATFGACFFWAMGVRTFNFDGHGAGKDKRKEGIDFYRGDHSINQIWPGMVTGEWHNNHHLYPNGARAGFLRYQWDYAWWAIRFLYAIGGVTSFKDDRPKFLRTYYLPYLASHKLEVPKYIAAAAQVTQPA